ncbi:Rad17-domain-containing protein [Saccharata proteae CBS 121410]|uniref:Rad17-domain-containing protein n=1 Tax=Saccharata proteae CBS 121410 TaxID=1314787 RepID=A0A9P4LZR2_9PEZI|nr:Rad17-domain-containing protein [Saccharata proteae CBS 121410]
MDEDMFQASQVVVSTHSTTALALRKRRGVFAEGTGADLNGPPSGSQKFLKTANGTKASASQPRLPTLSEDDRRPWTERFRPVNVEELAVHKKKVADVRAWLSGVFEGSERKRLLVLRGAAGTAKTTTVSLLSKELGFDIIEWKNPAASDLSSDGYVSLAAQFEDFVGRTGKFNGLELSGPMVEEHTQSQAINPGRQAVLIEEFPNTFTRSSSVVQSFRSAILQYLAASVPSIDTFLVRQDHFAHPATPIIMIISETLLSTTTAAADSFTAHRLLGPEILSHPGISVIDFNSIAPTILAKALELVVVKEARKSGRRKTPGPQVIKKLAEIGDVRSAISALEFLCVCGDDGSDWGSKVAFTKPKKSSREPPLTKMEQESLATVTQRESTLGIFHAVGKVVYNKRELPSGETPRPQPPFHLPQHSRLKVPEVDPDAMIDELGTDIQTFIAALHENYVLSCSTNNEEDTLDSINGCIDALSDSDLLSPDRFSAVGTSRRAFQGSSSDTLRQDEISFNVSVRGLLFNLPHPVKRTPPPMTSVSSGPRAGQSLGGKGNAHRMFYPASARIWRRQEEIEGLLELHIVQAQNGQFLGANTTAVPAAAKPGSVESWRKHSGLVGDAAAANDQDAVQGAYPSGLLNSNSAKRETLLERLPYMAIVIRSKPATKAASRGIEQITKFTGVGIGNEDDGDEDEMAGAAGMQQEWSTDRPVDQNIPSRANVRVRRKTENLETSLLSGKDERGLAGLVLSDDDIEDD